VVDFSSVNLRILSPDGKTVLAELQSIDKVAQRTGVSTGHMAPNMHRAAHAATTLSFAMSGATSGIHGAVNAAGMLAEQLALSTRNAALAAGAVGIGAVVAIGAQLWAIWHEATDQMLTFNAAMNSVGADILQLQLRGTGAANDMLAKREAILEAGRKELEAAEKLKINDEERVALKTQIAKKTREGLAALDREADKTAAANRLAAAEMLLSARDRNRLLGAEMAFPSGSRAGREATGYAALNIAKNQAIDKLQLTAQEKNFTKSQIADIMDEINKEFDLGVAKLGRDLDDSIRDTLANSLAGGIADAFTAAVSAGGIGAGFKAMTGAVLSGLGAMAIATGTAQLAFSIKQKLWKDSVKLFAPEAGIAIALGMIAFGAALSAAGGAMSGARGGGGGGGSSGGFGGGSSSSQIIDRGLINPLNPLPNTAGLKATASINLTAVIFGSPDDPKVQRHLLDTLDKAERRRS
jgi:hypothetical protein